VRRTLIVLTMLLSCAIPAFSQSWTLVQHPNKFTCTASSPGDSACSVTVTSTVAGHLLVLLSSSFEGTTSGSTVQTFTSASGDGAWTHCPAGARTSGSPGSTAFEATDCAYILSATGGATSVTFTWNFKSSTDAANIDVEFLEFSVTGGGTKAIDTQGTTNSSNCFGSGGSACIGPALTLAGINELVLQWIANANGVTSISGGAYTNPFDNDATNVFGAFAGALNQSAATAQTWVTAGSSGGYTAMSAIAFKAPPSIVPGSQVGGKSTFGGPSVVH
jgi:hypothetical protein